MNADQERQQAARTLVCEPVIDRTSPQALALVRRHRAELDRFFADQLGYRLDATRPGLVRLAKAAGPGHVARGLRTRTGRRFDPRRYALVCLVLAAVEAATERTTARNLFDEVTARAANVDGLAFSAEAASDRRAFVQAVQAVCDLGVLELAEGDEEAFARGDETGDALYRIDHDRLGLLPAVTRPPSLSTDPTSMLGEHYPDTDEGRLRRRRHRVMRALVEQPVVYRDDLDDDEVSYLVAQRHAVETNLSKWLGLDLEVRTEGWVAVDEAGDLTDRTWPDYGAANVAALRICDELRARRRRGEPEEWQVADVTAFVAGLAAEYAGSWRKDAETPDGSATLTAEAIAVLTQFRAVRVGDGVIVALPAAARFAAAPAAGPTRDAPDPIQESLS